MNILLPQDKNDHYRLRYIPGPIRLSPDFVTFWRLKNIISDFQQHRIIKG